MGVLINVDIGIHQTETEHSHAYRNYVYLIVRSFAGLIVRLMFLLHDVLFCDESCR